MATVSLNLPRQTSKSWIFDAASGVSVKLRTTIATPDRASHGEVVFVGLDKSGKNASLARSSASTSRLPAGSRYRWPYINNCSLE